MDVAHVGFVLQLHWILVYKNRDGSGSIDYVEFYQTIRPLAVSSARFNSQCSTAAAMLVSPSPRRTLTSYLTAEGG
jgi:hypothetical protein